MIGQIKKELLSMESDGIIIDDEDPNVVRRVDEKNIN